MLARATVLATIAAATGVSAVAQETAPPTCAYGEPHPAAPAELAQFAFLIGDYRITLHRWMGKQWSPPQPGVTARWNGRYALDGMAIVDEWFNPDPAQDPEASRGVNVRMYDAEDDEWDMMWIATSGRQVQDLRAKMVDGVLTMWQVYPEKPDFKAEFHVADGDHWAREQLQLNDDGEWLPTFRLAATRISCGD